MLTFVDGVEFPCLSVDRLCAPMNTINDEVGSQTASASSLRFRSHAPPFRAGGPSVWSPSAPQTSANSRASTYRRLGRNLCHTFWGDAQVQCCFPRAPGVWALSFPLARRFAQTTSIHGLVCFFVQASDTSQHPQPGRKT